jgi:hypothetical protein
MFNPHGFVLNNDLVHHSGFDPSVIRSTTEALEFGC